MAAYAALLSLSNILHDILHPPPIHHFILPTKQIESLQEIVNFQIDFLETYSGKEIADLEVRIADAVYSAEDIIESTVIDQIHESIKDKGRQKSSITSYFEQIEFKDMIQRMVEEFDFIQKELMKIKEMKGIEDLQPGNSIAAAATSSRPLARGKTTVVGFDKHLYEIMGALATDESRCRIIPIVGMGGIGKTTLATVVYNDPFIIEHFDIRAWVTVSQEYTVRELLLHLLYEINKVGPHKQETTDDELGLQLHQALFGRRYLMVMDDIWNVQAIEKLKIFLPENGNGCRILVTTRLTNLTEALDSCTPYKMDFLDEGESWDLLRDKIFAAEDCPVELEEIGKDIAERCGGLPLALVVIGGLLGKSERTREYWEFVAGDVTSTLNCGNDEHVMNILSLSYIHLPVHLKPVFLYLAMFPEDSEVRVSTLVRLWVAEGLIKHTPAKALEEVGHEHLEDLISRNLILVYKRGSNGKVKLCKIHDLVRDLCIIEAEKEKFLYMARVDNPNISPHLVTKRRLSIYPSKQGSKMVSIKAFESSNFNRSWLCYSQLRGYGISEYSEFLETSKGNIRKYGNVWKQASAIINGFKLLKVVHVNDRKFHTDISKLSNLRYVAAWSVSSILPMSLCWNLQTLVLPDKEIILPAKIWQMTQLRHLEMARITIPDPLDKQTMLVLENLQTLKTIKNFNCTEQVPKRIPNLKELRLVCKTAASKRVGKYCLEYLVCFKTLELLGIHGAEELTGITFPISLKKLNLDFCKIPWENLSIVGSLPNLEVLKLYGDATKGEEWNPIEGEFCRLKFLMISGCELKIWGAENSHFPCLECLVLKSVKKLREIPTSFAEILTLQVIKVYPEQSPLWSSAKKISDEKELLGYEPLQLRNTY